MSRHAVSKLADVEVNRVESGRSVPFNKVEGLPESPLSFAKTRVGRAVAAGIGPRALKEFGDAGQMSNVTSGKGVPDYLARIYADPGARHRFGLEWFNGDPQVKTRTVVEIDHSGLPEKSGGQLKATLKADPEEE